MVSEFSVPDSLVINWDRLDVNLFREVSEQWRRRDQNKFQSPGSMTNARSSWNHEIGNPIAAPTDLCRKNRALSAPEGKVS